MALRAYCCDAKQHMEAFMPDSKEMRRLTGKWSTGSGWPKRLEWIPREQNDICDVLSKKVLHDMGVVFKLQPE